ncbi:MAG: HAD family hydrolase [Timaviella obliquedivisa GSE-PSE-MK23-08B]|jgi:phosphoglycolate phosphatase|nr:HAD family hydrolase [Timaviella obliquedivisa GSE-PSE-MK23-08B]
MVTIRCQGRAFHSIQAVLFDKDGTLANSESFLRSLAHKRSRLIDAQFPGVQEPLLMAFGVDGDRLNPAGLMAIGTRQENEIAAAAYVAETGRDWIESLETVRSAFAEADQYMKRKADHTPLVSGVLPLLQTMTTAGLRLGILSSDSTNNVKDFVEKYQLAPYFQLQMGTHGMLSKPDPQLLQQACYGLGIAPSRTLVLGDSQADMQLARSGAAGCIGVTGGWSSAFHLSADAVIHQLAEIEVLSE